ncbi:Histidine kinase-, DNA gyrase B-, and HSP90-like ATPase [anaerobic digester metagenome]
MMGTEQDFSIVAVDKFIQATRDSGYKGTPSAISELIDNSIQANANKIEVLITFNESELLFPLEVKIVDNGTGMDPFTLRTALRFGGSTRFNDRHGLGRYGMGLPNSSFSQAKRVSVHTWQSQESQVLYSYLDIDEIARGDMKEIPSPIVVPKPKCASGYASGTVITWSLCDRLDNRRVSTLTRKLLLSIGQRFRHFLWKGVSIKVNGDAVMPVDPLFLHPSALYSGASQFGEDIIYEVSASIDDPSQVGIVRVRFSELPVDVWSKLSNAEKRSRGISTGAGVSIIRGGREVDYGWFFLGGKRRENYDDWWRCEIQFEPILDEAFGITHTKQQIRPKPHLIEALSSDMESIARVLNNRARKAHLSAKIVERFSASEDRASRKDEMLIPLPAEPRPRDQQVLNALGCRLHSSNDNDSRVSIPTQYKIIPATLNETAFFDYARDNGRFVLVLNPDHPFYKIVYKPLLDSESSIEASFRAQVDLILLAAARSEALLEGQDEIRLAELIRKAWSDTLATYLNG